MKKKQNVGKGGIVSCAVRAVAMAAARSSAKSACIVFVYQPKEPKALTERLENLKKQM